jgi:hypothetical protein
MSTLYVQGVPGKAGENNLADGRNMIFFGEKGEI